MIQRLVQIRQNLSLRNICKNICSKRNHSDTTDKGPKLRFVKLTDKAFTPTRGSALAAGLDLYSAYDQFVPAQNRACIPTDLQIELPPGTYGRIAARSGIAWMHFIGVGAGVIDADFRGGISVVLFNFSQRNFYVSRGERIAQLIVEKILIPTPEEVESLEETERGTRGFGSTGMR